MHDNDLNLSSVNFISYLDKSNIDYKTSGKNVSSGWIGVRCPYCDDHSNHLGISPTGFIKCWLCNKGGTVINLVQEYENCSYSKAISILNSFDDPYYMSMLISIDKTKPTSVDLPLPISKDFTNAQIKYLKKRRYNPRDLIRKYNLMSGGLFGRYRNRIIVPFYLDRTLVSFVARDITDYSDLKYLASETDKSILSIKETLYNIDNITTKSVVICEGVTDVWRLGDGSVALSGKSISDKQLKLLLTKDINRVFVLLDSDAYSNAEQIACDISGVIQYVELLSIDDGDPDCLSDDDIDYIRNLVK